MACPVSAHAWGAEPLKLTFAGTVEPHQRVLVANQDGRAPIILEQGWRLLLDYAVAIPDPALRRTFLEGVAVHRELQALHGASG